jgi:hypothetical protein
MTCRTGDRRMDEEKRTRRRSLLKRDGVGMERGRTAEEDDEDSRGIYACVINLTIVILCQSYRDVIVAAVLTRRILGNKT